LFSHRATLARNLIEGEEQSSTLMCRPVLETEAGRSHPHRKVEEREGGNRDHQRYDKGPALKKKGKEGEEKKKNRSKGLGLRCMN